MNQQPRQRVSPYNLLGAFQQLARQHATDPNDCTTRYGWWMRMAFQFYNYHPYPQPEQDSKLREYAMKTAAGLAIHRADFMHRCRFLYELGVLMRPG